MEVESILNTSFTFLPMLKIDSLCEASANQTSNLAYLLCRILTTAPLILKQIFIKNENLDSNLMSVLISLFSNQEEY